MKTLIRLTDDTYIQDVAAGVPSGIVMCRNLAKFNQQGISNQHTTKLGMMCDTSYK